MEEFFKVNFKISDENPPLFIQYFCNFSSGRIRRFDYCRKQSQSAISV